MVKTEQLLVDDELYVNDTTLEALSNTVEFSVRRSLLWTVALPLLVAGLTLMIVAIFWLIPREVGTLLREDLQVNQRFQHTVIQYLTESTGLEIIHDQVIATIRNDEEINNSVDEAVSLAISNLKVDEFVAKQVDGALKEQPLSILIAEFLESDTGRSLVTSATKEYFESPVGKGKITDIAIDEMRSPTFRGILIEDLDRVLSQ